MKDTHQRTVFTRNLKRYMQIRGVEQSDIVAALGITASTVSDWVNGKKYPRVDAMQRLADYLGVMLSDLTNEEFINSVKALRIPVLGTIPAGIPIEAVEDILDWEEVPADWGRGGKEYFGLKIKGDSMEPEYRSGDIVIFRRQDDCESGDDCAVLVNGNDATFKRVRKGEKGVSLTPLNPAYETLFYSNQEAVDLPVRILGVVVELRRQLAARSGNRNDRA